MQENSLYLYRNEYFRKIKHGHPNSLYIEANEYNEPIIKVRKWSKGVPAKQEKVFSQYHDLIKVEPKKRFCKAFEVAGFGCSHQCQKCQIEDAKREERALEKLKNEAEWI